jgi:DNA mismatch endonuclease (patch repair protein)
MRSSNLRIVSAAVSRRMRAVPRKNTAAERELQIALRRCNLSFRRHIPMHGCCPDIVLRSSRVAVFVDGDFWHGRVLLEGGLKALRKSFQRASREFWVAKITRNVTRDRHQSYRLRRNGWSVMRLWERDIMRSPGVVAAMIAKRVSERRQEIKRSDGA